MNKVYVIMSNIVCYEYETHTCLLACTDKEKASKIVEEMNEELKSLIAFLSHTSFYLRDNNDRKKAIESYNKNNKDKLKYSGFLVYCFDFNYIETESNVTLQDEEVLIVGALLFGE